MERFLKLGSKVFSRGLGKYRIGSCVIFGIFSVIFIFSVGCMPQYNTRRTKVSLEPPRYRPLDPLPRTYVPSNSTRTNSATRPTNGSLPKITGSIVVDAGHGGDDPGASGRGGLPEKQIVLMIANRLADELRACGARVVQTRRDDRYVSLDGRVAISNRYRPNLFVSIHADAAENQLATGTTIYVERNATLKTLRFAQSINRALKGAGFECRGIRRQDFRVLKDNNYPAILIECGYLTNDQEAAQLNSSWYRNKIARTIARGIAEYFGGR